MMGIVFTLIIIFSKGTTNFGEKSVITVAYDTTELLLSY